jgi:Ca-activated chloride channel family protein
MFHEACVRRILNPTVCRPAQAAALSFIQRQKVTTQVGLVAFSGFAELIHAPSNDSETLQDAIESLLTGRRTAVGSAILKALDAIAEVDPKVAPSVDDASNDATPTPVPHGAYAADMIVLLTVGSNNTGVPPLDAAQQAVDRGVRVYTIGFGTEDGAEFPNCGPQFMGDEPQTDPGGRHDRADGRGFEGDGFQGGGGFHRGIDEETLRKIADMTGGEYYSAESAGELQNVFQKLPTYLITKHETSEISVYFVALGTLLAALAVTLSLRWHPV